MTIYITLLITTQGLYRSMATRARKVRSRSATEADQSLSFPTGSCSCSNFNDSHKPHLRVRYIYIYICVCLPNTAPCWDLTVNHEAFLVHQQMAKSAACMAVLVANHPLSGFVVHRIALPRRCNEGFIHIYIYIYLLDGWETPCVAPWPAFSREYVGNVKTPSSESLPHNHWILKDLGFV